MIEQRTDEWFAERLGFATASRAADVLAEIKSGEAASVTNYRAELVCERLTGKKSEDGFTSKAIQRGVDLEPAARAWYCEQRGVLVTQLGFCKHPTIAWVGASPDSAVGDDGGLEIKCPNTATHIATLLAGKADAKYFKQMQWQMWVTGWKWVDFVSYDDRLPDHLMGVIHRVERDQKFIDEMEVKVKAFLASVDAQLAKLAEIK